MFGKSVGIRTIGRKCSQMVFAGHRWRKACWFEVIEDSLHPTKGWQHVRTVRKAVPEHLWNKAPAFEARFERKNRREKPSIGNGWIDMERARRRHIHPRSQRA